MSGRWLNRRTALRALAWALVGVTAAVQLTLLLSSGVPTSGGEMAAEAVLAIPVLGGFLAFAVVGALVASRQPANPIGWFLAVIGLSLSLSLVFDEHLKVASADPSAAFLWIVLFWQILWIPAIALIPLVLLLFPDGRVPSPRWRTFIAALAIFFVLRALADLGSPVIGSAANSYANPLPFAGLLRTVGQLAPDFGPLYALWFLLPVLAVVGRLRRSRSVERQQLKWFVYAAGLILSLIGVLSVSEVLGLNETIVGEVVWFLVIVSFTLLPVSIGLAIFRFHLYDIDLLINRTLVYGVLTGALGAVYLGLVILLQGLLSGFTGGSGLAVAASTLAVAALFQPARQRIQRSVDRRFYRSRYDAQHILEAFSSGLRHEVDLERLTAELRSVVQGTLQPRHVSIWLRPRAG